MIGPTGVGKTEIARRLARLADAPFIKVEATKFTEVGYVGRDVDTIIRDLVETAIKQTREQETRKVRHRAEDLAEERILDVLLPPAREIGFRPEQAGTRQCHAPEIPQEAARRRARRQGNRDRGRRGAGADGDPGAARHGGPDLADPGHVPEPRRHAAQDAQAQDPRGDEAADRGRGGQAGQRRGAEAQGAHQRRAERHRVSRRDRQDRQPPGNRRRRRLAPGRAARPAAAGGGHHGVTPSTA